ncbi:MAG: DCC1-like thiol-disulfide oxidoreductase family protein [Myxococcota bacterium]|nr:DCC1-like thiol-disulfide oxidoreductase family protein [Myxococcota bacterium]
METTTHNAPGPASAHSHVVLFDGVCNLCNGTVNFLIDRDPKQNLKFAPLQSTRGAALLRHHQLDDTLSTIILVEEGVVYQRSTAVLRITRLLSGGWPLLSVLLLVPAVLRDGIYTLIAQRRYRWFGQSERCRVPTPDLRERFLE